MFLEALLIGLVAAYGTFDFALGSLYANRPIILAPLVGLILGDLPTGIVIGATLELFFLGAISVGAYIPPDVVVGGVVATALSIKMGFSTEVAITLAMPIALLSLAVGNFITIIQPFFLRLADKRAAAGNATGVVQVQWMLGLIGTFRRFILTFLACYYGAGAVEGLINSIPEFVTTGMSAAAGLLPALGFAMLMRMILTKSIIPYFLLGFVLAAYLKVPALGVALIGFIIISIKFSFFDQRTNVVAEKAGVIDDEF